MRPLVDLLFPTRCAGCRRGDVVLCRGCAAALAGPGRPAPPSPCPPGLPVPYAVADYDGPVRTLLLAYKERDMVALTGGLATALENAVTTALTALPPESVPLLVPVPSTFEARCRRGYDPVLRLTRDVGRRLRLAVVPALTHRKAVRDSAGLSAVERRDNLQGALEARRAAAPRLEGHSVVLVDDVVTTGATLAEAARALRAVGAYVPVAATVAATRRAAGLARPGLHNGRHRHYGS